MNRPSLRRQVVVTAILVTGLIGFGGMVVVQVLFERRLRQDLDDLLVANLRGVAAASEFEDAPVFVTSSEHRGPKRTEPPTVNMGRQFTLRHRGGMDLVVAAWEEGRLLHGPSWLVAPGGHSSVARPGLLDGVGPSGMPLRLAWASFVPHDDHRGQPRMVTIVCALPTQDRDRNLKDLMQVLVITGLLTGLAATISLVLALRRALQPLSRLADDITALDPGRPGRRLESSAMAKELAPLAERVNDLCDRLETAHGLASSIRGVAAHELRTPLAGLRATIEVAQGAGGDPEEALVTCHGITLQMQSRVDNLLIAARLDAGQMTPRREEVDVRALLEGLWTDQATRAQTRGLTATWQQDGDALAEADPEALRMVFTNLVDNSVSHSPVGGVLEFALREDGAFLLVTVANPAPALEPGNAARIFARGWRNAGGTDEGRHAGLGMAICRELVGLMRGTITARIEAGRLLIDLRLPSAGTELQYW